MIKKQLKRIPFINHISAMLRESSISRPKISYSQSGEDIIVGLALRDLGIKKPYYLDIGAHHPVHMSNTFLLYQSGFFGVCVEADPFLCEAFKRKRIKDECLNLGLVPGAAGIADFYVMTEKALSTFDREEAEKLHNIGRVSIEKVIKVKTIGTNDILGIYCKKTPDFISLDIEGNIVKVLEDMDFDKYGPAVFLIETLTYSENKQERKIVEIVDFMKAKGYFVFGDTFINTIFVKSILWDNR